MNPKYYVTPEEARKVIDFLDKHRIGGGVGKDEEGVWKTTVPRFVGPFQVPTVAGKAMLGIVLRNGVEMNAGLTLDLMSKGYPDFLVVATLKSMADYKPESRD